MAGIGLLTTVGVIVSMDSFGPVTDNAQGIAEMSGDVDGEGAQILTNLDAIGNTTKAITKGIAIATAVLAATALFGSFKTTVQSPWAGRPGASACRVDRPNVLVGLILGAAVVFMFSSLLIMRSAGPPSGSCSRSGTSSATTRGSWTTPRRRSTGAWWTSAPGTRCASWSPPACWPC